MQRSETPPVEASSSVDVNLMFPAEDSEAAPPDWPRRIERPEIIILADKSGVSEPTSEVPTRKAWVSSPRRFDTIRRLPLARGRGEWRLPELQWRAYVVPALAVLVIAEAIAIGVQYYSASAAGSVAASRPGPVATDVPQPAPTPVTSPGFAAAPVAAADSIKAVTPAAVRGGWVEVRSPVDVDVWEGRRRLGESSRDRIELSEGDHQIDLVNDQLGFRESKRVRVTRGRVATVSPVLPTGVLHVNASPWAEVSLDGQALGTTPLGNVRTAIGGHDLTFRHPQLGNRTVHVTVTVATPVRTSVDMREQ